jgi:uncharacterized protein YndB with AHSA1/START domain
MRFMCRPVDTSFFDTAPMRFKIEVELDAPPAIVFAIFDDEQSWPEWFRAIHKVVSTTNKGGARYTTEGGSLRAMARAG